MRTNYYEIHIRVRQAEGRPTGDKLVEALRHLAQKVEDTEVEEAPYYFKTPLVAARMDVMGRMLLNEFG